MRDKRRKGKLEMKEMKHGNRERKNERKQWEGNRDNKRKVN